MTALKVRHPAHFKKWIVFLCLEGCMQTLLFAQPSFTPQKVFFHGLKRTKTTIVSRELSFIPGQAILLQDTADFFKKSCFNIFNTTLFNYCTYRVDSGYTDSTGHSFGQIHFRVSERWYTFPVPIFELADRNFNEWWYDRNADFNRVNIGLKLIQKNVRGRNEELILLGQAGFTRRFDFSYFFPYLNHSQTLGLKIRGSYANNRDVAYRSSGNRLVFQRDENSFGRERMYAGFQFTLRRNIYSYHTLDFTYLYNRISSTIFKLNPAYFAGDRHQRFAEIRYAFIRDRRDFRYFAHRGSLLQISAQRSGFTNAENFHIWAIRASYAKYWKLNKYWFFATKADGETSNPAAQPYYGTRVLGFENRFVRGYERYVMEGNSNFHIRNSLRFKFLSRKIPAEWVPLRQFQFIPIDFYLSGIGDLGYVGNPHVLPENKRLVNTLLAGYGLGLNVVTFYDLVLRFEYSINIQGDRGLYFSFLSDI